MPAARGPLWIAGMDLFCYDLQSYQERDCPLGQR
jgi:hypothetical protein